MLGPGKDRTLSILAVVALAAFLLLLAVLQYRWSEEISQAASARMQAELQRSMMSFRQAINHDLSEICLRLQPSSEDANEISAEAYARRLINWQTSAAHPELVSAVYLLEKSGNTAPQFLLLDPEQRRFVAVTPQAEFASLQQQLSRMPFAGRPGPPPAPDGGPAPGARMEGREAWAMDLSVPALIHPMGSAEAGDGGASRWLVIALDRQKMEQRLLPEQARRNFALSGKFDYNVAVVGGSQDHPATLYTSSPEFTGAPGPAEEAMNLFGPPGPPGEMAGPGPGFERNRPSQAGNRRAESSVRIFVLRSGPDDREWQLVVGRLGGSLEETVARLRLRNLAVSFGILLVLAATMAIVIVNAYRARRLAQLQMDFVTGVSHELRTPLSVILSASENIKDGVVSAPGQVARYGSVIYRQTRQLMQLVEQVLLFASSRQSRLRLQVQAVELNPILERALENAGADGCKLERQIEPGLPLVQADSTALTQALHNIIANAVKYGAQDRWLGVRAYSCPSDSGTTICVGIEDHGIGISREELPHIFDPFYRSPGVAGSNVHGTGLGLPLARSLVEAMGGSITVESEPGRGSSFTVHLRTADPRAPLERAHDDQATTTRSNS